MALIGGLRSRMCSGHDRHTRSLKSGSAHERARRLIQLAASAALAERFSGGKIPKQLDGIGTKSPDNCNKFNDINAALAAFVFGNKRLRPAEFLGQRLLTNARGMSHCDKDRNQPCVFRGFKGLLHVPPGMRIGGRQFDPEIGLSQNWIILTAMCHIVGTVGLALDFGRQRERIGGVDHCE